MSVGLWEIDWKLTPLISPLVAQADEPRTVAHATALDLQRHFIQNQVARSLPATESVRFASAGDSSIGEITSVEDLFALYSALCPQR